MSVSAPKRGQKYWYKYIFPCSYNSKTVKGSVSSLHSCLPPQLPATLCTNTFTEKTYLRVLCSSLYLANKLDNYGILVAGNTWASYCVGRLWSSTPLVVLWAEFVKCSSRIKERVPCCKLQLHHWVEKLKLNDSRLHLNSVFTRISNSFDAREDNKRRRSFSSKYGSSNRHAETFKTNNIAYINCWM